MCLIEMKTKSLVKNYNFWDDVIWFNERYVDTYMTVDTYSSSAQVKIQFRPFLKKEIQLFMFRCCSTHKDLSNDV